MTFEKMLPSAKLTPQEQVIVEHFVYHANTNCNQCLQGMALYYEKRASKRAPIARG